MATISSNSSAVDSLVTALGAGSGIDMAALATNLANAQFAARTDRLTAKSETLDRQISAAANLKSMLSTFAASLGERVRMGDLSSQPQVGNAAVAQANLTGAAVQRGSYSLEVTALAKGQILASPAYASSAETVGSGTLTLRFGTVAGGSFTEDTAHAPATITIAPGATLADAASAINGAKTGVTAYVANTAEGAKLVLKGAEGAANGFVLEAAEDAGDPGLSALAWTPAGQPGRLLEQAGNAAFKLDGLEMASASNTVKNALPGVSLTLTGTNAGAPTTLNFTDPSTAIASAMRDFTAALNELASEVRNQTNPLTGDLARDSGARSLRLSLSTLAGSTVMPNAAPGAPRTLADLGLALQRDGTFALDEKRLTATLTADPQAAAAMFTNGVHGIFATINKLSLSVSSSSESNPGFGYSVKRYSDQKAQIGKDQAKLAEQQEALRARLVQRFAVADTMVGNSRSTLSFLQNQIDAWNARNS
ncbi:MAG: flagellar filament capping protein FliD [Novosphingobium sp.]|nr:flagellar filament capping protein FliD [Novosphingobium sp.]